MLAGDSILVEGPTGTGKSVLASQFLAHNAHAGEPGAVFLFEERPDRFTAPTRYTWTSRV